MSYAARLPNEKIEELDLSVHTEESSFEAGTPQVTCTPIPKATQRVSKRGGFDYADLSGEVVKEAEAVARRIRDRLRGSILTTGADLLNIKVKLGHGRFGGWLDFHFGWKERTAQNYMNAADAFRTAPTIIDVLPAATIYKLAAKSTPESLREAVVEEINGGTRPDPKEIERRILATKAGPRQEAAPSAKTRDQPEVVNASAIVTPGDEPAGLGNGVAAPAEDTDLSEGMSDDADRNQRAARKIAEFIKIRSGKEFEKVRAAILTIDLVVLRKAFQEV